MTMLVHLATSLLKTLANLPRSTPGRHLYILCAHSTFVRLSQAAEHLAGPLSRPPGSNGTAPASTLEKYFK